MFFLELLTVSFVRHDVEQAALKISAPQFADDIDAYTNVVKKAPPASVVAATAAAGAGSGAGAETAMPSTPATVVTDTPTATSPASTETSPSSATAAGGGAGVGAGAVDYVPRVRSKATRRIARIDDGDT